MKIITCASFYGSGSSALTDLVAEYDNVKGLSDFEFRFLHDIDGVSDLEFHLCECHNRHNSGHALKRFIRLSKFNEGNFMSRRYTGFFGGEYKKLTKEYVSALNDFCYTGWWFYDLYDKGTFWYYFIQLINHAIVKLPGNIKTIPQKEQTYCAHPSREKFLAATQEYTSKLLHVLNSEGKEYLEVDQIVPSQNINRILRYFKDDIYVFVVDRDPRDVYTLAKLYWGECACPVEVDAFCNWFRYVRESGNPEEANDRCVMKIHFEDLIYRYEETVQCIEHFTGLSSAGHGMQFKKLNPKRSVHNTQIWKKHPEIADDIKVIENKLSEFLYCFDAVKDNVICGVVDKDTRAF